MAKLYPPNIAGTLPSFYIPDQGTATLVVPFSMNKTVSVNQVKDMSLRIKTTNTDILYGVVETNLKDGIGYWNKYEKANPEVSFEIPQSIINKLSIGQFYKVQLAYIDTDGITGYYSTVSIIKYTAKPEIEINGFIPAITNLNPNEYLGVYRNLKDPTEKAYEYKFDLFDRNDKIIETSGWLLHNSYEDVALTESIDRYVIKYALKQDVTYKVQYSVRTNNNLVMKSFKYLVMDTRTIEPEIRAKIVASLDYNNACINLNLIGEKSPEGKEYAATGKFTLSRASSLDNFSTWLAVSQFHMTGELPSAFLFKDYAIEQGATYIYSLQQSNDYGIYSNRLYTEKVEAQFEDAYLFDGERQLKIRFNPKVSSFKTTVLDSKKNTIGSKYPFIFRNGAVAYKEFPISGLISYMMDNDEFFLSKEKDLFIQDWKDTTDIIDENVYLERRFKLAVLDWLNDGKVKLFKSPQEGNYIVRLMNVSMTPIDSLSRMLHNFSCQATEIADFTPENLQKYELINTEDITTYQMRWETLILHDEQQKYRAKGDTIYGKDLLNGYGAYYVKFTDIMQGVTFEFIDSKKEKHSIMIGATGAYEIQLDEPIYNLCLTTNTNIVSEITQYQISPFLQGSLTFSILSASQNKFDTITTLTTRDIPLHQTFGPQDNILDYYSNIRRSISRIYYSRFSKLEVREVYNNIFGTVTKEGYPILSGQIVDLQESTPDRYYLYDIQTIDNDKQIIHHYYRYYQGQIYEFPHFSTNFPNSVKAQYEVLNEYTLYRVKNENGDQYYRVLGDRLIKDSSNWNTNITNNRYEMNYTDLTPYVIYHKKIYKPDGTFEDSYYKFTGSKLEKLNDYSTQIICKNARKFFPGIEKSYRDGEYNLSRPWINGDLVLDVADRDISLPEFEIIPEFISIGSGVSAELGMQVKYLTYNVEQHCELEKQNYLDAVLAYKQACLNLEEISKEDIINQLENNIQDEYFIWKDEHFYLITDGELNGEGGYLFRDINIYHPTTLDKIVSQSTLDQLYDRMIEAEKIFINRIDALLEAQKKGAEVV